MIKLLCWNYIKLRFLCKLNSIETLISRALVEMKISHEEFNAIFKEKDKYETMKNMRQ